MGDVYDKLVTLPSDLHFVVHSLVDVFHYKDQFSRSALQNAVISLVKKHYFLRTYYQMVNPKKKQTKKKAGDTTHWANFDLRPKEAQKHAIEWMSNSDNMISAMISAGEFQSSFSLKAEDEGKYSGWMFLPIEHDAFSQVGIRASGKDAYTCLTALLYKYAVLLPDYELPTESIEDLEFS